MLTFIYNILLLPKNAMLPKHMKGAQAPFDESTEFGLPSTMGAVTKRALFKSVRSALKGDDPVLNW